MVENLDSGHYDGTAGASTRAIELAPFPSNAGKPG